LNILVRKLVELDLGFPVPDTDSSAREQSTRGYGYLPDIISIVRYTHDGVERVEDHLKGPGIIMQRSSILVPRVFG
jgi:hypothetical protein